MRVEILHKELFRQALNQVLPELEIHTFAGITSDSRKVQRGDIFLAIKGGGTDGHHFIEQAEKAGAAICIVEKNSDEYNSAFEVPSTRQFLNDTAATYRKNIPCPFIGITGTNGKTTTKDLLAHVLSASMEIMSTKGNFNSTIGAPLSVFECGEDADVAIIEMGANKPGEIEYICEIVKPDMGIITNVYEAHIEFFGTIDAVAETKSALFSSLPKSGTAFVNMDDKYIPGMSVPCNRVEYSFLRSADFNGKWSEDKQGISINGSIVELSSTSHALGMNVLAVFSIASHLDMKPSSIQKQIESFQTPSGRGNVINLQDVVIINDSYNANLESARSGINNLASLSGKSRKIAVIGDMLELGAMDKEHHRVLGKHLSDKKVDAVFAFGDLTRHTIHAMNGAAMFHQFYDEKTSLLTDLKEFLMDGDIVYVKGSRGMKMEEIITGLQD